MAKINILDLLTKATGVPYNKIPGVAKAVAQPFRRGIGIGQDAVLGSLSDEERKRRQAQAGILGKVSQATELTPEEQIEYKNNPAKFSSKVLSGQTAFFVPGGQTTRLGKILTATGSGALAGYGSSKEGNEVVNTLMGGTTGALTMGLITSKPVQKLFNSAGKIIEKTGKNASGQVSKATPSAFQKAAEKGIDINASINKYMPAGATVEDMVGDVSQRGKGGIIGNLITQSEEKINNALAQSGDDIIATTDDLINPLIDQVDELAKVPGNQAKTKALKEFIEETKSLFPDGFKTKDLLDLKRVFDDKFGQSVIDDTGGAVINDAQKKMANTARVILKKTFGEIKDALDTESELYTLRPILNRARGIAETQGSTIRRGSLAAIDLTKPGTVLDAVTTQPRVASTLSKAQSVGQNIQGAAQKIPSLANLPPQLQQLLSTALTTTAGQPQQQVEQQTTQQQTMPGITATNSEDLLSKLQQSGIDPAVAQEFTQKLTGGSQQPQQQASGMQITPEMASLAQILLPASEASKITKAYDIQQKSQDSKGDDEKQGKAINALQTLKTLFGRGDATNVGTEKDIAQRQGYGVLGNILNLGNIGLTEAGFKPKTKEDYKKFKAALESSASLFTQALGSGTPQEGEFKRLLNSAPSYKSTDSEVTTWFNQMESLLTGKPLVQ